MKKLTEFRITKKLSILYMLFIAFNCLLIFLFWGGNWNLQGVISGAIPEIIENIFGVDVHYTAPFLIISAVIIRLLDLIFTSINYNAETGYVRYPRLKHKLCNVLGLISLPVWTVLAGIIFYFWCYAIFDELIGMAVLKILFIIPAALVFVCSLSIDIHGLRSKSKETSSEE